MKEVKRNIEKGIKNVTLLGQNVNDYAYESVNFLELLGRVSSIEGLKEVDFI